MATERSRRIGVGRPGGTAWLFAVPWTALVVVAAFAPLWTALPDRYRWAPLIASVVVLGLPHGAVDHLAVPRLRGERPDRRWLAVVGGLYLALGSAVAGIWFRSPAVGVVAFVLVTWFHWGQGDLYPLVSVLGADHLDTDAGRALSAFVRGGIPMVVPLVAFPDRYRFVVGRLLELFEASVAPVAWAFEPTVRLAVGAVLAAATVLAFARCAVLGREDRLAAAVDAGELLLLWAFFWAVPPLVAVGVYFCFWHSLRHVARLMAADGRSGGWASLCGFARDAAPLSAGALLVGGGLALAIPASPGPGDVPELVALYLVLIAVLTPPHVAVVLWMDREQGVWDVLSGGDVRA